MTRQRKGVNVEELADSVAREVMGEASQAPDVIAFTKREVELILRMAQNVVGQVEPKGIPMTPEYRALIKKLAKAKIVAMIRQGMGLQ